MWLGRARRIAVLVVVLAISAAAGPPAPQAQGATPWPTTEFEIYFLDAKRDFPGDAIDVLAFGRSAETDNEGLWATLVADYLRDIAIRYETAGFRAPHLGEAVGGGGYRVFLGDAESLAWYARTPLRSSYLAVSKTWFEGAMAGQNPPPADLAPPSPGSEWDYMLYKTLAHELFHAVQEGYAEAGGYAPYLSFNSRTRLDHSSVDEGLPDGMARWALSQKFPGWVEQEMPSNNANRHKYAGMYAYHAGYVIRDPSTYSPSNAWELGYRTSSFWFNLLERWGPPAIHHLLSQKIPSSMTSADLVKWLDDGLKENLTGSEGLYGAYNHFLTEMAAYGEAPRYKIFPGASWFDPVFGNDCLVSVTLDPSATPGPVKLDIPPLGGACVRIEWQNYDQATFPDKMLHIEVRHSSNDRAILDQINLGLAAVDHVPSLSGAGPQLPGTGTCWKARENAGSTCTNEKLQQPSTRGGRGPRISARTWEYDNRYVENDQGKALFVLTNVALDAVTTQHASGLTIHFAMNTTQSHTGPARSPSQARPLQLGMPTGQDYMRLRMYGVNPDPPLEQTIGANPLETTLVPIAIPKGVGQLMDVGYYVVMADPGRPMPFGATGPLYGTVLDMSVSAALQKLGGGSTVGSSRLLRISAPDAPASQLGGLLGRLKEQASGGAGSMMCESNEGRPIGQVQAFNDDRLQVRIDTDICAGSLTSVRLVERLDVTATLPFGWRYQHPAPTQEITPALEYFVDRFHDRLEGRLSGLWFGGPPDLDAAVAAGPPSPGGGSGNDSGGGGSSAATATVAPRPCDCGCEGFKAFEELSKRRDAAAEAEMKAMMPCMKQCMVRWTSCMR